MVDYPKRGEMVETPADEWEKGLGGFHPAPVFDISQTKGKPLPELETEAFGEAGELVPALLEAASSLKVEVNSHGERKMLVGSSEAWFRSIV